VEVLEEPRRQLVGAGAAARAPVLPGRLEHEVVDDQLRPTLEQVEQADRPLRALERVLLHDLDHGEAAARDVQRVSAGG
jgi:hypothetical protein